MHNDHSNPTLVNVVFSGNAATGEHPSGLGGGMFNYWSGPTLVNVTFGGNSANRGGGLFNYEESNPTLTNAILWHDSTQDIGNIDAASLFVDIVGGDLRLWPGSPCIDAGNGAALPSGITADLDGNPRIVNSVVDMGAYEALRRGFLPLVLKNVP